MNEKSRLRDHERYEACDDEALPPFPRNGSPEGERPQSMKCSASEPFGDLLDTFQSFEKYLAAGAAKPPRLNCGKSISLPEERNTPQNISAALTTNPWCFDIK